MEAHPPTTLRHPELVDLTDAGATDERLVGAKAANLALAQRAGLPVLPGAVLTTAWDHRGWSHPSRYTRPGPALAAWRTLGNEGERPLVVRSSSTVEHGGSSSTVEHGGSSSTAGVLTSVLDVSSWSSYVLAVDQVLDSARHAGLPAARMAVLVQPQIAPRWGGVLLGTDPVTGRTDRLFVAAVQGGPDRLAGGLDDGWTAVLSRRGRPVGDRGADPTPLPRRVLRSLARLGARAQGVFGGPQDLEWAIDHDGTSWLLQSRPVADLAHLGGTADRRGVLARLDQRPPARLAEAQAAGADRGELAEREPVVLRLVAPHRSDVARDSLRVRARWAQEPTARAAWQRAERPAHRGVLPDPQPARLRPAADDTPLAVAPPTAEGTTTVITLPTRPAPHHTAPEAGTAAAGGVDDAAQAHGDDAHRGTIFPIGGRR